MERHNAFRELAAREDEEDDYEFWPITPRIPSDLAVMIARDYEQAKTVVETTAQDTTGPLLAALESFWRTGMYQFASTQASRYIAHVEHLMSKSIMTQRFDADDVIVNIPDVPPFINVRTPMGTIYIDDRRGRIDIREQVVQGYPRKVRVKSYRWYCVLRLLQFPIAVTYRPEELRIRGNKSRSEVARAIFTIKTSQEKNAKMEEWKGIVQMGVGFWEDSIRKFVLGLLAGYASVWEAIARKVFVVYYGFSEGAMMRVDKSALKTTGVVVSVYFALITAGYVDYILGDGRSFTYVDANGMGQTHEYAMPLPQNDAQIEDYSDEDELPQMRRRL